MAPIKRLMAVVLMISWGVSAQAAEPDALDLMWDDLQPPVSELERLSDADQLAPSHAWQSALPAQQPGDVVPELDGKRVRIPAYVVALDGSRESLTEMLLVPYFGACIHVPPPPPNQIIHIQDNDGVPVSELDLYRPVWATGVIRTESVDHEIAQIGYRMEVEKLTEYNPDEANN